MATQLSFQRVLLAAVLATALVWPLACGDSTEAEPGGASSHCVVDGQPCPHGCDAHFGCVECTTDADCGGAEPICVAGECVECGVSSDCRPGEACFPRDHECHPACDSSSNCPHEEPLCDPATGACVGCLTDDDCVGDEPFCSHVTKQCVECDSDDHCGAARPICDFERGRCRECMLDIHCPASRPLCDDHECVELPEGCEYGGTLCGDRCVDTTGDPRHCGGCGRDCDADEYCDDSSCVCRPGLTPISGQCVDLQSDPDHCGSPDRACEGATPQCEDGDCVDGCDGALDDCGDACVDLQDHPLHCGECDRRCERDEVCAGGDCESYRPAIGCSSCPCASCTGGYETCCSYPGDDSLTICVQGGSCP